MNAGNRAVKITAKTALKNNMLRSIFSVSIIIFSVFICTYLSYLVGIIFGGIVSALFSIAFTLLIIIPLCLGVLRFFWRILFSVEDNPVSSFYYFSSKKLYFKSLSFILILLLKVIPPAIILAIPVFGVWLVSKGSIFELANMSIPLWTANLSYIFIFLRSLAVILLILYMIKYYMAPLFFVADENMDSAECFHMSTVISKKTSLDFSFLLISFWGWILLSMLIIPLIFTLPYMITSFAVHFRFAVAEYNKHIENVNAQNQNFTQVI